MHIFQAHKLTNKCQNSPVGGQQTPYRTETLLVGNLLKNYEKLTPKKVTKSKEVTGCDLMFQV